MYSDFLNHGLLDFFQVTSCGPDRTIVNLKSLCALILYEGEYYLFLEGCEDHIHIKKEGAQDIMNYISRSENVIALPDFGLVVKEHINAVTSKDGEHYLSLKGFSKYVISLTDTTFQLIQSSLISA